MFSRFKNLVSSVTKQIPFFAKEKGGAQTLSDALSSPHALKWPQEISNLDLVEIVTNKKNTESVQIPGQIAEVKRAGFLNRLYQRAFKDYSPYKTLYKFVCSKDGEPAGTIELTGADIRRIRQSLSTPSHIKQALAPIDDKIHGVMAPVKSFERSEPQINQDVFSLQNENTPEIPGLKMAKISVEQGHTSAPVLETTGISSPAQIFLEEHPHVNGQARVAAAHSSIGNLAGLKSAVYTEAPASSDLPRQHTQIVRLTNAGNQRQISQWKQGDGLTKDDYPSHDLSQAWLHASLNGSAGKFFEKSTKGLFVTPEIDSPENVTLRVFNGAADPVPRVHHLNPKPESPNPRDIKEWLSDVPLTNVP